MSRRRVGAVLAFLVLLLAALGGVALWLRHGLAEPHEHNASKTIITIEPGMGTREIVARLADAGVVENRTALLAYLIATGKAKSLKAGDYQFDSPISALDVVAKIERGEVAAKRVTIPEGKNRFDIAEILAEKTKLGSRNEFLNLMNSPSLIRDLDPLATSLEGYLFPDTYEYTPKTTPEELVRQMVDRFHQVFKPEWSQLAAARGMTLHQVMTLASLVEEEARVDEDRPRISSVFYNRLAKDMKLESDPTFIYAAIALGDYDGNVNNPKHRKRLDPYNTYVFPGLPPGPIANPGRKSIEAALQPEKTDYIYFVVRDREGHHAFAKTSAEHERNVEEYRKLQRQEREAAQQAAQQPSPTPAQPQPEPSAEPPAEPPTEPAPEPPAP